MGTTVIVALPAVDDKVYRISSEKAPHLTLAYLGESVPAEDLATIMTYVQHAASELSPFYMTVDYRGTLGVDDADVVFFDKKAWDFKRIADFRHYLLLNDTLKKAYDSVTQYPEWTPHLTLGYPEKPAKKDESDWPGIHSVQFDRIAVWIGDSEGPEFRLKYDDNMVDQVAGWSDMSTGEKGAAAAKEIFHTGTKGMKWGVRRANNAQKIGTRLQDRADKATAKADRNEGKLGNSMTIRDAKQKQKAADRQQKFANKLEAKTAAKLDKKSSKEEAAARKEATKKAHEAWKKDASGPEMANKVFQKAAKDFEKTADIINNDPNYKGKDVTKGLVGRQYQATMNHYFNQHLAQASIDLTMNDQGRAYIYQYDARTALMRGVEHQAVLDHADVAKFQMPDYKVELDELGHMVGFSVVGELFHHGVKGMRWGVTTKSDGTVSVNQTRVRKSMRSSDKAVTVSQRKPGTYVKAKGGQRQTASTDAVRTQAARRVAKKSTTDALSTKQLKDTIERMRLEQEFAKLDKRVSRKGKSFVNRLFQSKAVRETTINLAKKAVGDKS